MYLILFDTLPFTILLGAAIIYGIRAIFSLRKGIEFSVSPVPFSPCLFQIWRISFAPMLWVFMGCTNVFSANLFITSGSSIDSFPFFILPSKTSFMKSETLSACIFTQSFLLSKLLLCLWKVPACAKNRHQFWDFENFVLYLQHG